LLGAAATALAKTSWFAEYGLTLAEQERLTKKGCFRGSFSDSLSLTTCDTNSGVHFAELEDDAFLCVVELPQSNGMLDAKHIVGKFPDAVTVFGDSTHLVIRNFDGVKSDACHGPTYNGVATNVVLVPRTPIALQTPINWKLRAVQRSLNSSSVVPDPLIQEMVNSYSQDDVTNYLKLLSQNAGSNLKITRNSYSINVGTGGCADSTWKCAKDAASFVESEANRLLGDYQGEWLVERVSFRNDMCPNIVVTIDGASKENVIIGAHLDSRNTGSGPTATGVAPGADDNGSGSAVLLSILKSIAQFSTHQEVQFQYTLKLMWFCGEEQGLIGSDFLARRYKTTGEQVIGMFNNDMIGYTDSRYGVTLSFMTRSATAWLSQSCKEFSGVYVPTLKVGDTSGCCSDQQSWFSQGFPAAGIFETPTPNVVYPDYHRSTDTFDNGRVNLRQVFQFGQANFACALEYAVPSQGTKKL